MFSKFLSIIVFFCFIFNNHALSDKWNINIEGYLSGFKVGESNVIFEINVFEVKNNTYSKLISMIFLNDNHYSFGTETTYQSLMEEICNLNRSKNWM